MQKDVAEKLGIEVSYLYMIETGMRNPSDKLKHKICELYGIDMNTLFLALELTKCKK
jgi:transcriptional regulator with XRE-family HTH domain